MKPRRALVAALLTATGVIAMATPAAASPVRGTAHTLAATSTAPAIHCRAEWTLTSVWAGGFQGKVKVTNTGPDAARPWSIEFDLPSGASLTNGWNGTFQQSDDNARNHVRIDGPSWLRDLAPGQYAEPGFVGTYVGTLTLSNITLNEVACTY